MPVRVEMDRVQGEASSGKKLFQLAEELGVRIPTSCLGRGRCRECMVEVTEGRDLLSEPTEAESHLEGSEIPLRLSCQAEVVGSSGLVSCHTLRRGALRIQETADGLPGSSSARDVDPAVTRDGDSILLDGQEIEKGSGPLLGVAVDLGTTTVVVRLHDLESGELVAHYSFENPQRFGGSDVLARVSFDAKHPGGLLRRTLLGYLAHALDSLPCQLTDIYEVAVAGNTVMRDMLFGLDVQPIGVMPYRSTTESDVHEGTRTTTSIVLEGAKSGLPIHPRGRVYGLPLVGSHVGADTAACLLAVDIFHEDRLVLMMDIGTNTEVVIGRKGKIHAASCPAGPAFEGGVLHCGMPGLEGAVERVKILPDGSFELEVIGEGAPQGICGSGLVDLAGELLRTGRMNRLGRLGDDETQVTLDDGGQVFLTEEDLSYIAQAKAANAAGLHLVHKNYGVSLDDVDVLYLAGGFARHLDLDASRRIGLIPDLPNSKIVQVGNAALEGCSRALLSVKMRKELERSVLSIEHVELETFEDFFHYFAEGIQFAPLSSPGQEEESSS